MPRLLDYQSISLGGLMMPCQAGCAVRQVLRGRDARFQLPGGCPWPPGFYQRWLFLDCLARATIRGHCRLRYGHVDAGGKVSIRHAGRMHHLGIGSACRGQEILAITDTTSVTVIELRTGEVLSVHDIDPTRAYWRNKQRSPGRWPGPPVT